MLFAHDAELSLLSAVALVNSAEDPDTLTTRNELAEFFTEQGYSGRFDGDDAELEAVRALRPTLRALLTSSREDAVVEVNRLLAESSALPRLVRHGDLDWHVHAVADDSPLATRIVVETAMAMIDVIRADELSRFDVCADPDCNGLVLDLSRNRSRRFCSTTCGNRAAVAAYRARKAQ
ncbi:RNA-binding protein [Rhodococcus sp. 14-2483-1-1]|uniref:CGNR zinc finger domain-containing protein n=1 Tax=Nocardiaceae TaxID=85025 RepID=UPI00050D0218|nr:MULTISPECIES: CGNR zinc finger domain-containing protein [Rhodococcus]OZC47906.1 RNA-binding protein [Rhodococcus sp. WWJCD1]OZC84631.1 RNA-binding protein [Rhodococcus sp. 06-412-2C]OZC98283.1 RNA-binding protein [Rhodococcus sp. 06-412-2B]OZE80320.1 RNA-binding protein [Rhodococcus sp. 15-649-2-2]OZF35513.1 RNA-binding protein [Rhodococcus sp. 14-2483-1-1]